MTRRAPNLTEKLDAALLALMEAKGWDYDREKLKGLPAGSAACWFDFDHYPIPHAQGGSNHPTNLVPRLRAGHREKTAKRDIPMIAKGKRISKEQEAFRRRMLAKLTDDVEEVLSRPQLKPKIKSAGFDKIRRKKFNGTVEVKR